jgi:hypothetical protein
MTGPEHYQRAEQLLDWAAAIAAEDSGTPEDRLSLLAEAQAHATLALAAATAVHPARYGVGRPEQVAWSAACHVPRSGQ